MGFLADLGRSQAVTNTTQALQNLQKNQQAIRMGEQQESLNEMELQKQKVAMQKMAEQDADLNRTIDITTSPAFLSAPPELQKSYLDFAMKGGFVDQSGRGKKRNVLMMQQQMMADEKTFESFAKPRAEAAKGAVVEAYTAYQTLKDKPDADPEKLEKSFAAYKKAEANYLGLTGNMDKVMEGFRAKDELQKSFATLKSSSEWGSFPPLTQALLTEAATRGDKEGFDKIVLETVKNTGSNKEVTNEYKDFIIDRMNKGDSKQQALEAWQKRQAETAGLKREQITLNMPAPSEKSETTEQIVKKSLKEQLGREPTYVELDNALKARGKETKENPIAKEAEERRGKILEGSLRREFNNLQEVKDFKTIKPQYENMKKAIEEAKTTKSYVAVDQSLIMLFNKMLDPQSTVRIEEYARTPQDIAMVNRVKGKMDKLLSGGAGLTSDERQALMAMGKQFYKTYQTLYQGREKEYNSYMPEGKAITSGEIALEQSTQPLVPKTADDFKKKYGIGGGQ